MFRDWFSTASTGHGQGVRAGRKLSSTPYFEGGSNLQPFVLDHTNDPLVRETTLARRRLSSLCSACSALQALFARLMCMNDPLALLGWASATGAVSSGGHRWGSSIPFMALVVLLAGRLSSRAVGLPMLCRRGAASSLAALSSFCKGDSPARRQLLCRRTMMATVTASSATPSVRSVHRRGDWRAWGLAALSL